MFVPNHKESPIFCPFQVDLELPVGYLPLVASGPVRISDLAFILMHDLPDHQRTMPIIFFPLVIARKDLIDLRSPSAHRRRLL